MHPMLNIAIQASRNAARLILRYADRLDTIQISEKSRNDIVTDVDRLAEQEIIQVIRKAYPNHGILAEEGGASEGDDYLWIIDPLDGTTNFIHGFPQYAISIALKYKKELLVAVVYDPIRNEMYTATRGVGAQLNSRRIRVSQARKLESSLIGTGFPFKKIQHLKPYLKTFETLFPQTQGIRRAGSAALGLAYVAAGRLEGYWEADLQVWDMAAGVLLIKEAGGIVSDFLGSHNYFDSGNIIAGTPKIHKLILDIVEKSIHS